MYYFNFLYTSHVQCDFAPDWPQSKPKLLFSIRYIKKKEIQVLLNGGSLFFLKEYFYAAAFSQDPLLRHQDNKIAPP